MPFQQTIKRSEIILYFIKYTFCIKISTLFLDESLNFSNILTLNCHLSCATIHFYIGPLLEKHKLTNESRVDPNFENLPEKMPKWFTYFWQTKNAKALQM